MRTFIGSVVIVLVIISIAATVQRRNTVSQNVTSGLPSERVVDTIILEKNRFIPTFTSIKVGESVVVVNKDTRSYTLATDDPSQIVGLIEAGSSKVVNYLTRGTYKVFDTEQPGTSVTIQVE